MYYTDNPVGFYTKTNTELKHHQFVLTLVTCSQAEHSTSENPSSEDAGYCPVWQNSPHRASLGRLIPYITINLTIGIRRSLHCRGKRSWEVGSLLSPLPAGDTWYQNTKGLEVTTVLTVPSEQFISLLRYSICLYSASALPVYAGISHQLQKEPKDHGTNATLSA